MNAFSCVAKIFERAAKEFSFGEHRERRRARGFESSGKCNRIKRIANYAARRRCRFQLGDNIDAGTAKFGRKITQWRCGFDAILQRGFRQNFFSMLDFEHSRFENAIKYGSSVRGSRHEPETALKY